MCGAPIALEMYRVAGKDYRYRVCRSMNRYVDSVRTIFVKDTRYVLVLCLSIFGLGPGGIDPTKRYSLIIESADDTVHLICPFEQCGAFFLEVVVPLINADDSASAAAYVVQGGFGDL